jgi:hypothetical protein
VLALVGPDDFGLADVAATQGSGQSTLA